MVTTESQIGPVNQLVLQKQVSTKQNLYPELWSTSRVLEVSSEL
jgi:hypothetical protein